MASFPPDRFDDVPEGLARVGAHRRPPRPGRALIRLAWAALATGVLVVAGLFALSRIDPTFRIDLPIGGGEQTPGVTPTPAPSATPVTDPSTVDPELELVISVLNGTATQGLQNVAADQIRDAGWPDPVRANAASDEVETTRIFYAAASYQGIALGLAELLGAGELVFSDVYPGAPVTILLGTDYIPPSG